MVKLLPFPERPDYAVRDEGTLILLWPITDLAESWVAEHLEEDTNRWGSAYVIEHRFAQAIIEGLHADGLVGTLRQR